MPDLSALAMCFALVGGGQICLADTSSRDYLPAPHLVMVTCALPPKEAGLLNVPPCPKERRP